jgi:hypothetical protein
LGCYIGAIHIFLYGWWPIVHKRNIYQKRVDMDISIGTGFQAEEKRFVTVFQLKCVSLILIVGSNLILRQALIRFYNILN